MNEKDEIKDIFRSESRPRKDFIRSLRTEVLTGKSGRNKFLTALMRLFSKKQTRMGLLTFAGILVFSGIAAAGYMSLFQMKSPAQEADLLQKISERNADILNMGSNSNRNGAAPMALQADSAASTKLAYYIDPSTRDYSYLSTTTTYTSGPSLSKCVMAMPYGDQNVKKVETKNFFTNKTDQWPSYTKYATYDNSGTMTLLMLTQKTSRIEYHGGKFAVKYINQPQIRPLLDTMSSTGAESAISARDVQKPEQSAAPTEIQNRLETVFGPEVKIVGQVSKNGKDYYKIQWTNSLFCDAIAIDLAASTSIANTGKKGYFVALADANSLEIVEESVYLDSVADANLVYSYTIEQTRKSNVSENDVVGEFSLDSRIPVRTVDYSKYDSTNEYISQIRQFIQSNNVSFLQSTTGFTLTYLYSEKLSYVPEIEKYILERDYYAPTDAGTKEYNDMKSAYIRDPKSFEKAADLRASFVNQSKITNSLSVGIFKGTISSADAINRYLGSQVKLSDKGQITLTLDGKKVTGSRYTVIYESMGVPDAAGNTGNSVPAREPEGSPAMPLSEVSYSVFSSNGQTYVAELGTETGSDVSALLQFNTVSSQDSKALEAVFSKIKELSIVKQ